MHEVMEECIFSVWSSKSGEWGKTDVDAEMKKTDGRKSMVSEKMNEEKHLEQWGRWRKPLL